MELLHQRKVFVQGNPHLFVLEGQVMAFVNLFYKYDESFVPVFDGRIEEVVGRVGKLEERVESQETRLKRVEELLRKK